MTTRLAPLLLALAACSGLDASRSPDGPRLELVETAPVETTLGSDDLRDTFEVWRETIDGARSRLDFAHFYASNRPGSRLEELVQAVERAAGRGVRVRFLAEQAFQPTYPETLARMAAVPGIEVRLLDLKPLTGGVLHAKALIADGETAFVGSANFDWRSLEHVLELGVLVRAPGTVAALQAVFDADWEIAGGADPRAALAAHPVSVAPESVACADGIRGGRVEVTPVFSPRDLLPQGAPWDLPRLVGLIDGAREVVRLEFLSLYASERDGTRFDDLTGALERAAARGVRVELMLADWAKRRGQIEELQRLQRVDGLEVRLVTLPPWSQEFVPYGRVAHAKFLVADGRSAWVGTSNASRDYFHAGRNLGLLLEGAAIGARLDRFFGDLWSSGYAYPVDPDATYEPPRIQ